MELGVNLTHFSSRVLHHLALQCLLWSVKGIVSFEMELGVKLTASLHRYFISFLLDSTAGLLVIYLGLKLTQILAHRSACKSLYFGEYGK